MFLPQSWMFRIRPAAMVCLATFTLGAQESSLAERLYVSGDRAYARKAYTEALETWNQLLSQAPQSPFAAQALVRLARHQMEQERKPEAALPFLERLKNEHIKTPWAAEGMLMRGRILMDQARKPQDLREAMGEFNRLADLFPDHPALPEARYRLGLAYEMQGQWSRALQHHLEALRLDPTFALAPAAHLRAAEVMDILGDLPGCLRTLQELRLRYPQSSEAKEAQWRLAVRVKHRLQKPVLTSEGPWPNGKTKWLKTPTLLAVGPRGDLFIYQDDRDQAFRLEGADAVAVGPLVKNAKALTVMADGQLALLSAKNGITHASTVPVAGLSYPTGLFQDGWQGFWVSDAKNAALTLVGADGATRTLPSPAATAMASLPTGGAVVASDANRSLLFLDATGQPKLTVPYGKDLPAPFRSVLSLASDPTGHVAAIVEGPFEGVVLWGPDGALLRFAAFKTLGLNGRFRAIALDRTGGVILADRSNDLLIRLN
ncbi:MAG: tetratricopeptide repeat protein [Firmicutes bacterium]|nr:tetratricopeptide repeat protein [Bacillota bacterium]